MEEIKITLDGLTIGDLETLDKAGRGELNPTDLITFLDKVVVGDVRELPLTAMPDIVAALTEAMTEITAETEKPPGEG